LRELIRIERGGARDDGRLLPAAFRRRRRLRGSPLNLLFFEGARLLQRLADALDAVVELLLTVLFGDIIARVVASLLPLRPSLALRARSVAAGTSI